MNKQEIEKVLAYWKEFKSEIPGLKVTCQFPDLDLDEQEKFTDLAISSLEKQIPKKPIKNREQNIRYTSSYSCPSCGDGFTGTGIADYCYHCGQKLLWEG